MTMIENEDEATFRAPRRGLRWWLRWLGAKFGFCRPPGWVPSYDFFKLSQPRPVADSLPIVHAPRGGISYIKAPDLSALPRPDEMLWEPHHTIRVVYGSDIVSNVCRQCRAIVPHADRVDHENWHKRIEELLARVDIAMINR